jgi:hypothetical protein
MLTRRKILLGGIAVGAWLAAQPAAAWTHGKNLGVVFHATDYGVAGVQGVDYKTQLFALAADCIAANGPVTIYLPPGTIGSTDPRWLLGVNNATIIGDPVSRTSVQSLLNQTNAYNTALPLWVGTPFYTNTATYSGTITQTNGFLFNTAAVGATSITLTNPSDAGNFSIGKRIILYGYETNAYGGIPGARYFEWQTVTGVTGNVVGLSAPLKNSYNSLWADLPDTIGPGLNSGAPRALLLDASYYSYPSYLEFKNIRFANNPYHTETGVINITCDTLVLTNCLADYYLNSEINRQMTVNGGSFMNGTELDRMCGDITLTGGAAFGGTSGGGIAGAYEADNLVINGVTVSGSISVCPKMLTIENTSISYNSINGSIWPQPAQLPVSPYTVKNLTLNNSVGGTWSHIESLDNILSVVVGRASGNNIVYSQTSWTDTAPNDVYRRLGTGTIIQKNDGTKTGTVQDVTYNSVAQEMTIIINPSGGAPVAGETWQWRPIQNFTNLGGHTILDGNAFTGWNPATNATLPNL